MALHIENLPPIVKASTTQITLASTYLGQPTVARIGGQFYRLSALTLNTGTSGIGGLDTGSIANNTLYYVYLVVNGSNVPGLVMSTSSSAPTGFTRYKYIGKTKTFFGSTSLVDVNPLFVGNSFSEKGIEVEPKTLYTPDAGINQGLGTITSGGLSYTRVGDCLFLDGRFSTGTVTASEARLALPNGLTISTLAGGTEVVGRWSKGTTGGSVVKVGTIIASQNLGYIKFSIEDYTNTTNPYAAQLGNAIFQNSQALTINGTRIPITEYSGLFT